MSQAQAGTVAPATLPALAVALIRGRVESKPRTYKDRTGAKVYATLLRLPNPDEFTTLGTVEVNSSEPLGEVGDTWAGKVRISGSVRAFSYADRTSGEMKAGTDVTIRLTAI